MLPRRHDLRLTLSDNRLAAGESLFWRLGNFGTGFVSYGLEYEIERFDQASGGWAVDPLTPSGVPSVGFTVGAGQAGNCQSLAIPAGTPDGRYRLSKPAQIGSEAEHRFTSEFWLSD